MKALYTQKEFDLSKSTDKLLCECKYCGKSYLQTKKDIANALRNHHPRKNNYCSRKCMGLDNRNRVSVNCANCQIEFEKFPVEIKKSKSGNHFCSRSCASIYNNKHKITGTRRSKLESYLETKLIEQYPDLVFHFNHKDTINSELDIYIPSLKLAFELNGIFHYEPIFGDNKLNKIQNNDNRKFQACLEQGIELCIIDSSQQKYFKERTSQKYLKIIVDLLNSRLLKMDMP